MQNDVLKTRCVEIWSKNGYNKLSRGNQKHLFYTTLIIVIRILTNVFRVESEVNKSINIEEEYFVLSAKRKSYLVERKKWRVE